MRINTAFLSMASLLASSSFVIKGNAVAVPAAEDTTQSKGTTLFKRHETEINCKGSLMCGNFPYDGILDDIDLYISRIDPLQRYENGHWIACRVGICAFLQQVPDSIGSVSGHDIQRLMGILKKFGCKKCGSVPVNALHGGNDFSHGMLTLNFVNDAKMDWDDEDCEGVCKDSVLYAEGIYD